jgi:hypothetical protein
MLNSQITRCPVVRGDFVDNPHCLFVPATAHQIFWAFVQFEREESDAPQYEHQPAHREQEISPPLIRGSRAVRRLSDLAGIISNQRPGYLQPKSVANLNLIENMRTNQTANQLSKGPPDGKDGEKVLMGCRDKLFEEDLGSRKVGRDNDSTEEYSRVHGQVSTDADRPNSC